MPHTLAPYPETTLVAVLDSLVRERPDHLCLWFKGRRLSVREIDALSDAFAAGLVARGMRSAERLALLLPNCPQFVIATLGAWKAGLTVVPLNPLYTEDELQRPLASTEARAIVALSPFYERVKRVQPRTSLELVIGANIKEFLPTHLRILFSLFKEKQEGHRVLPRDPDVGFATLLGQQRGAPRPEARIEPRAAAFILLSGGTTGTPKGVVAEHRSLVITACQLNAWYASRLTPWQDTILLPLPLFHAFGCVATLGSALVARQPIALVPNPRDLADLIATIRRVRPAFFVGVPTLYNALLNHPEVAAGRVCFRSMKLCVSGASPLLAETRQRFEALTGGRLVEAYSMTEAVLAAAVNPLGSGGKPGSVGVPLPDVEMRIVDADDGLRPLPAGEVGEVLIRAPQIMSGYWRDAAESALALRPHGDGGASWLHTGDLGYFDADSFLFLVDRKKDLIKLGGLQVWPREIEEVLAAHPAVSEAAVAGVPDAEKGEVAKAWVVLRPGMAADAETLRAFCRERLAPFKAPSRFEFRKELPKSLVGKVLRRVLVQEEKGYESPTAAPSANLSRRSASSA